MTDKQFIALCLTALALWLSYGFLYNDAAQQARDIKTCEATGAKWRYNSFNQVLCVPKPAQCKEYFKDEH